MLHIYAALAEKERALISERTRLALQAAKKRGVILGNPNIGKMNTDAAASRDAGLMDILMDIGVEQPYKDIAEQLTLRGVPTPRGGDTWNAMVLKRLGLRQ